MYVVNKTELGEIKERVWFARRGWMYVWVERESKREGWEWRERL